MQICQRKCKELYPGLAQLDWRSSETHMTCRGCRGHDHSRWLIKLLCSRGIVNLTPEETKLATQTGSGPTAEDRRVAKGRRSVRLSEGVQTAARHLSRSIASRAPRKLYRAIETLALCHRVRCKQVQLTLAGSSFASIAR